MLLYIVYIRDIIGPQSKFIISPYLSQNMQNFVSAQTSDRWSVK